MNEMLKRIHLDRKIMVGKPVVRGTRITVEHIMKELALDLSPAEIVDLYPNLTVEDIRAACAYAASSLADESFEFLAAE